jgi:hypothetical protein
MCSDEEVYPQTCVVFIAPRLALLTVSVRRDEKHPGSRLLCCTEPPPGASVGVGAAFKGQHVLEETLSGGPGWANILRIVSGERSGHAVFYRDGVGTFLTLVHACAHCLLS